jgi:Domain of unknown function (DUF4136)
MRHKSRNWISRFSPAFVAALITCSAAQGQEVRTHYARGTDFSKYRTYSWVPTSAGAPNQIIDIEIMRAIDSQLVAKGFTKVESVTPDTPQTTGFPQPSGLPQPPAGLPQPPAGLPQQPPGLARTADSAYKTNSAPTVNSAPKADLLIRYQVAINRETQWNAYGWGDRFPGPGLDMASGTATSSTIEVGTLVLDIYDPIAKRLVWEGTATKTISLSKSQEKNQKNLDKAMQKLMKDFPPRQG